MFMNSSRQYQLFKGGGLCVVGPDLHLACCDPQFIKYGPMQKPIQHASLINRAASMIE